MRFDCSHPLPRLYFAHTPKTGGLALGTVLRDAYGWHARFPAYARRHLVSYTMSDLQRYHLFSGHWGIGFLDLLPADTEMITVVREPIEQVMSWWHHMARTILLHPAWYSQEVHLWRPILEQNLAGTLASPFLLGLMTNMQSKHLGLRFDLRPFVGAGEENADRLQSAFLAEFAYADDAAAFAEALKTLRRVAILGVTEQFDATLKALCRYLGVPRPRTQPQNNLNPQKATPVSSYYRCRLDPDTLHGLEAITQYDRLLYAEGLDLFAQQQAAIDRQHTHSLRVLPTLRSLGYRSARWMWRQVTPHATWLRRARWR